MNPVTSLPSAPRILIRGTNWLGDAVMTTPALLRLREKFPAAKISILTPETLAELWKNHPAIDEVIASVPGENIFAVASRLRAGNFDLALALPNSPRSALEIFLAGIPQRIGYARPWRNLFLTQKISLRDGAANMRKRSVKEIQQLAKTAAIGHSQPATSASTAHQIHDYLHLVSALGANPQPLPPKLFVAPEEVDAAKKKFGLDEITAPVFGLNAGAEYGPAKRWPAEKFVSAAKEIRRQTNCAWVLFGGKNDLEIAGKIEAAATVFNFAGKTSLRELMALLKCCRLLLTNDTGPMHLAAALAVPTVAIFGSTSPELTGPIFSDSARVLKSKAPCSPCFLRECPIDFRCMNGISVESVVEAAVEAAKI